MTADDLLRARARLLARPDGDPDDVPRQALLRFECAGDRFVVTLAAVRQVVRIDASAWLPFDAWPLVALAPLGDQIVPVLDLTGTSHSSTPRRPLAWGVVVLAGTHQVGVAADEVLDVVELTDDEITWTGAVSDERARVASGVTAGGDAVIDLETIASLIVPASSRDPALTAASARSPRP